jgi:lipopolysaccharide transport system ATP-binding protein
MSDVVIHAEGLSKVYRINHKTSFYAEVSRRLKRLAFRVRGRPASGPPRADTFWALKDVSFEVRRGEKVGIVGRNGAGKSTLLKILSRIVNPTAGWVEMRGRVGSLLEVGAGFNNELSGRKNIYLNGTILGMKRSEITDKLDEIIGFAELAKFVDTPLKHYSSGMRSRLAFSIAAHLDADILLVDEVLAVGDMAFQKKCLGRMNELTGYGRTVLFVSHSLSSVTRLCNRILLLENGRLDADGAADAVAERYVLKTMGAGGVQAWTPDQAPGNEELKLVSVRLLRPDGLPGNAVTVDETLQLEIAYQTQVPQLSFRCAAIFYTEGVVAFASVEPFEKVRPYPSVYTSTVTIPAHLLAEKEYSVCVSIYSSRGVKRHFVNGREAIAFHVKDLMRGDSARGDYAERIHGVVRPKLNWQSAECLSKEAV